MTLQHPMFPPRADREYCSPSERFSTCVGAESVKTGAAAAPVFTCSDAEQVNGATAEPFLGGAGAEQPNLYLPTNLTPEELFQALGRLRNEAEEAVERLIALIDALDGDIDAEPSGDELEPSLGAPENHPWKTMLLRSTKVFRDQGGAQLDWASGNDDDCEGGPCHDDREGDELEHGGDEHDGREPDVDNEPLLGSFDRFWNQEHAWRQTSGAIGRCWDIHSNCDAEQASAL